MCGNEFFPSGKDAGTLQQILGTSSWDNLTRYREGKSKSITLLGGFIISGEEDERTLHFGRKGSREIKSIEGRKSSF